ncbi:hypothetical protein HZH66_005689 [Vespula vulgaris]|uniref:G-protein coupled receptors family 1 profile domain-containing protein n=1 Tax=Vespula vulgaris TaxID=7454 RepID=A0A834N981_VESVU|nr:hypothetical protein HZH66_005689 [Vespula vulgaris]
MEGKDETTTEDTLFFNLTTIDINDNDELLPRFPGKHSLYTPFQAILIALVLVGIIVGTVIGNILVCVAVFLVRKLRRPCNYLLVSLAVSDLCVALLVMPMALLYEISHNWTFGALMCDLWVSFDVLSCTASILNLCMISLDRAFHSYVPRSREIRCKYLHYVGHLNAIMGILRKHSFPPFIKFLVGDDGDGDGGSDSGSVLVWW